MANSEGPSSENPLGTVSPLSDSDHAATAEAGVTLKLVGVATPTNVAGGVVLAALRAWNRRRQSRKRERGDGSPDPTGKQETPPTHPSNIAKSGSTLTRPNISSKSTKDEVPTGENGSATDGQPAGAGPTSQAPIKALANTDQSAGTDRRNQTPRRPTESPAPPPPVAAQPDPHEDSALPVAPINRVISEADSIAARRATAHQGGGQKRIDAQHARGKLTARERIKRILDPDTFEELAPYVEHRHTGFGLEQQRHSGDGVVTGFGLIDGRRVAIFAQDFTVLGGSFSEVHALKVGRLLEAATSSGLPIISLLDSVGARIQEGVWSLAGFGDLFWRNTQASGVVPQISLMLGPCAGGAVYSPGLTDFVVMTRGNSFMFITGPEVIRTVTGEEVDVETLGGASTHAAGSGVAHFVADDENCAFALTRRLLSYLPSNNVDDPPALAPDDTLVPDVEALDRLIPEASQVPYDVRDAIGLIADSGSFLEVQADFAPNAVVGFARLSGRVVAFVANQPSHLAGVLDIDASDKIARFIRFSDAFNIPIVTLVDCPGFLPGSGQEHQGIIRHGAKIVYAYSEATVPKVSVVLRKAYGGAYIVMSSKMIRTDVCFAWPTAEIAVMGPKGAVNILYARQLASVDPDNRDAERARLENEFQERFNSPFVAASAGHIDDVIYPRETRARVTAALEFFKDKQTTQVPKKHGNIPL
ncbi:MAG: acyl-CoA carboxylase subunit beta [Acidobacteriota bacterium]|nr:acyl-CoA carboxylase subunit beta [Acidobacteriota bacterium]